MIETMPTSGPREASPELVALIERLEDPRVASGLQNLLDHVDLLAILVVGLDGFVSRSELIGEALVDGVSEIRELSGASATARPLDIGALASSMFALSSAIPKLTPAITRVADDSVLGNLLDSGIVSQESLAHIGLLATAVNQGAADATLKPIEVKGARSIYRQLKDPDVARGLGYTLNILKAVGRELAAEQQKGR